MKPTPFTGGTAVVRKRANSVRGTLLAFGIGALIYVGIVGVDMAFRIGPAAARLSTQSRGALAEFQESRRRSDVLDDAMTDLWRLLGEARRDTVPMATLEDIRFRLQAVEETPRTLTRLVGDQSASPELLSALSRGVDRENTLAETMFGVVAALELRDVPVADRLLRRADSLDAPLSDAMADATTIALRAVNGHEDDLASAAASMSRMLWLWILAGLVAMALLALFLHRRLYVPLAAVDHGLARISAGDLSVHLSALRDDELGRLSSHFNRMTGVLRQRARDEDQRMADERAARTRLILDSALDAVIVMDERGVIREWNPQAEVVLGWSRGEVIGASIGQYVLPPEFRVAYRDGVLKVPGPAAANILNRRVETVAKRKGGGEVHVEVAVTQLRRGDEIEYCAFVRDLTERRAAQAALLASEVRYHTAFDQAAVGMAELALDGRFLRVNDAFGRMLGYLPDEVVGRRFGEFTHADDAALDSAAFDDLVSGRVGDVHREKRYVRKDGTIASVRLGAGLVHDASGAGAYVLSVFEDVSARKRLEHELNQVQKMEAVGRLAGGIAHDFNNLLAGIMGYADLLQHAEGTTKEVRDDARAIIATAQHGADLAQNLLTLARRSPQRAEPVDLREVIAEARKLVSRTFDRSIEVETDFAVDALLVRGDRSQLTNAVLNLAINAKDAMPDGGRLTITARHMECDTAFCARFSDATPGRYVAITVRDTGTGMAPETRARIFEPFFTTKAVGKGTGLGLSVVYGTVRSHDGFIDVESEPGRGSSFTLYLPARGDAQAQSPGEAAALVTGRGRILIADDEDTVRTVVGRMLERLGYDVDRVNDGEKAVAMVREKGREYGLVLLDGDMPRMTGREAAPLIREIAPDLPLVFASGNLDADSMRGMAALGFAATIAKPYSLADLSRLVASQIEKRNAS
ncbi:MAG TPA: PAS domain S-box protein [Gemmatimonadaceae bacterium]|nr:PAS domain S-box protein [Gemmatimonadaceae bacterium]